MAVRRGRSAKFAAGERPDNGSDQVRDDARDYRSRFGSEFNLPAEPATVRRKLDPELSRRTADAFEAMQHTPHDPQVKKAYDQLKKETIAQYEHIVSRGLKVEPWLKDGQPYENSADMRADVAKQHLWFFPTVSPSQEHSLGASGGDLDPEHNPMVERTGHVVGSYQMTANDLFRAVHDYYGHAKEGHEFGPAGEYNAYHEHAAIFSPLAQQAMMSETHGRNSWVNFGKHIRRADGTVPKTGDPDYIHPKQRPFAEQKAGLLPPDAHPPKSEESVKRMQLFAKIKRFQKIDPEQHHQFIDQIFAVTPPGHTYAQVAQGPQMIYADYLDDHDYNPKPMPETANAIRLNLAEYHGPHEQQADDETDQSVGGFGTKIDAQNPIGVHVNLRHTMSEGPYAYVQISGHSKGPGDNLRSEKDKSPWQFGSYITKDFDHVAGLYEEHKDHLHNHKEAKFHDELKAAWEKPSNNREHTLLRLASQGKAEAGNDHEFAVALKDAWQYDRHNRNIKKIAAGWLEHRGYPSVAAIIERHLKGEPDAAPGMNNDQINNRTISLSGFYGRLPGRMEAHGRLVQNPLTKKTFAYLSFNPLPDQYHHEIVVKTEDLSLMAGVLAETNKNSNYYQHTLGLIKAAQAHNSALDERSAPKKMQKKPTASRLAAVVDLLKKRSPKRFALKEVVVPVQSHLSSVIRGLRQRISPRRFQKGSDFHRGLDEMGEAMASRASSIMRFAAPRVSQTKLKLPVAAEKHIAKGVDTSVSKMTSIFHEHSGGEKQVAFTYHSEPQILKKDVDGNPNPHGKISKLSEIQGTFNPDYEAAKKAIDPNYVPGETWHQRTGSFTIHPDGTGYIPVMHPRTVRSRYYNEQGEEIPEAEASKWLKEKKPREVPYNTYWTGRMHHVIWHHDGTNEVIFHRIRHPDGAATSEPTAEPSAESPVKQTEQPKADEAPKQPTGDLFSDYVVGSQSGTPKAPEQPKQPTGDLFADYEVGSPSGAMTPIPEPEPRDISGAVRQHVEKNLAAGQEGVFGKLASVLASGKAGLTNDSWKKFWAGMDSLGSRAELGRALLKESIREKREKEANGAAKEDKKQEEPAATEKPVSDPNKIANVRIEQNPGKPSPGVGRKGNSYYLDMTMPDAHRAKDFLDKAKPDGMHAVRVVKKDDPKTVVGIYLGKTKELATELAQQHLKLSQIWAEAKARATKAGIDTSNKSAVWQANQDLLKVATSIVGYMRQHLHPMGPTGAHQKPLNVRMPGTGVRLQDRRKPARFAFEDQSLASAIAQVRSQQQQKLKEIARDILHQFGLSPHKLADAISDTQRQSRPGVVQTILKPVSPEHTSRAAAQFGLISGEKNLLVFHGHPDGPDSLYAIDLPGGDEPRQALDAHGIMHRVLLPTQNGFRAIIHDKGRALRPNIEQLARKYNASVAESTGTGQYLGERAGSDSRAEYRKITRSPTGTTNQTAAKPKPAERLSASEQSGKSYSSVPATRVTRLARITDRLKRMAKKPVFDDPFMWSPEESNYLRTARQKTTHELHATADKAIEDKPGLLPTISEVKNLATVGESVKGEYNNAYQTLTGLMGHKLADVWVAANSVLSAQTPWQEHTAGATRLVGMWHERNRPKDDEKVTDLLHEFYTTINPETGKRAYSMIEPEDQKWKKLRFLLQNGENIKQLPKDWIKSEYGGVGKTPDMVGAFWDSGGTPIDTHMVKLSTPVTYNQKKIAKIVEEKDPSVYKELLNRQTKVFQNPKFYLAYKKLLHAAAEQMGWEPREAQESVWTGLLGVAVAKGLGAKNDETLNLLNHEAVSQGWDMHSLFSAPELQNDFLRAGVPALALQNVKKQAADLRRKTKAKRTGPITGADPEVIAGVARRIPAANAGIGRGIQAVLASKMSRGSKPARFRRFEPDNLAIYTPIIQEAAQKHFSSPDFQKKLSALSPADRDKHDQSVKHFMDTDLADILRTHSANDEEAHDAATKLLYGTANSTSAFLPGYKPEHGNLVQRYTLFVKGHVLNARDRLSRQHAIPFSQLEYFPTSAPPPIPVRPSRSKMLKVYLHMIDLWKNGAGDAEAIKSLSDTHSMTPKQADDNWRNFRKKSAVVGTEKFAKYRAPEGGMIVQNLFYPGGKLLPLEATGQANTQQSQQFSDNRANPQETSPLYDLMKRLRAKKKGNVLR